MTKFLCAALTLLLSVGGLSLYVPDGVQVNFLEAAGGGRRQLQGSGVCTQFTYYRNLLDEDAGVTVLGEPTEFMFAPGNTYVINLPLYADEGITTPLGTVLEEIQPLPGFDCLLRTTFLLGDKGEMSWAFGCSSTSILVAAGTKDFSNVNIATLAESLVSENVKKYDVEVCKK